MSETAVIPAFEAPAGPDPHAHLARLNPKQRRAVEYGAANGETAGPLLVIAGAGLGKTNFLAHRVAHGADSGANGGGHIPHHFSQCFQSNQPLLQA